MQFNEEELEQQAFFNLILLETASIIFNHFNSRSFTDLIGSEAKLAHLDLDTSRLVMLKHNV
jgi:hypothetical protein